MLKALEIYVEERSMETFLNTLLPRALPDLPFQVLQFKGKQDLLTNLESRLSAYGTVKEQYQIIVLVDQDSDDCAELKSQLEQICANAGFTTYPSESWNCVTCIVMQELEAWYFAEWSAVQKRYSRVNPNLPTKEGYRDSDKIPDAWENFEQVLQRHGYIEDGLRKNEMAREIAGVYNVAKSTSTSFKFFLNRIYDLQSAGHI